MKIYVINLERDYSRRANVLGQLARLGWEDVEIVRAVDGAALPSALLKKPVYNGEWVQSMRGTIGCFLSHIAAWERIAAGPDSHGVVLEDDVKISDLDGLRALELGPEIDMLFINDRMALLLGDDPLPVIEPLRAVLPRLNAERMAGGGDGYVLSRAAAQRIIAACDEDGLYGHVDGRLLRYATSEDDLATMPRDSWIGGVIREHHNPALMPGLGVVRGYVLRQPIVTHQPDDSTRELADGIYSIKAAAPVALTARNAASPASSRQGPDADDGIPIRYWNRIRNVGDAANPYVVEHVSGLKPGFCFNDQKPHLLAIGSVMFMATPASIIWGSGVLDPRHPVAQVKPGNVRAVRGALTQAHLQKQIGLTAEVAQGDPGIFITELPEIRDLIKKTSKRYKYVVIPHHDMFHNDYFQTLARSRDVLLLDVRLELSDFISGLLSADIVVSQSLHGLIFAEVLGLPHVWISHTDDEIWQFKFRDWFSTTEDRDRRPLLLGQPLEKLRGEARLSGSLIDRGALRAAFPGDLRQPRTAVYDFRATRQLAPLLIFIDGLANPSNYPFKARQLRIPTGNDEALRTHLNSVCRDFDEAFETILVFDSELFSRLNMDVINSAIRLLGRNVDRHYVHLMDRDLIEASEGPFKYQEGLELTMSGNRLQSWRGVVIARHGVNFSFDAPAVTAFV